MQLQSLLGHIQELLGIIRESDRPADSIIDSFFRSRKYLGSHDRRFIAETAYGTLRHLRRLEFILQQALGPGTADVLAADGHLLMAVTYLLVIEKQTRVTPEVLWNKLKGERIRDKLPDLLEKIPVVDNLPREPLQQRMGIEYSYPDWLVGKLLEQFGETEAEKICRSMNESAPLTLRVNTIRTTVEECQSALAKDGIETRRTELSPFGLAVSRRFNVFQLKVFREGWFEVQDEGSQLLPLIADPKPTEKVLDACAGAGGKTLELAALMKNRGEIIAAEVNTFRLGELRKRSRRAGTSNIRVKEVRSLEDLFGPYQQYFDVVFIDAPCSGLGTIRRNPGMKWMVTEEAVSELCEKQATIVRHSAALVKPGGRLIYATCTLLTEENERIVEGFLSRHNEFSAAHSDAIMNQWQGSVSTPYFKLLPHVQGTDGFFCAVLNRRDVQNA